MRLFIAAQLFIGTFKEVFIRGRWGDDGRFDIRVSMSSFRGANPTIDSHTHTYICAVSCAHTCRLKGHNWSLARADVDVSHTQPDIQVLKGKDLLWKLLLPV